MSAAADALLPLLVTSHLGWVDAMTVNGVDG